MSQAPEDDDERTIVRPSSGKGAQLQASVQLGHTLPNGTRIRDYEITSLIGEGGFGIVYLAYDHSLQRSVAIKEYMPSSMASRVNASATVVVKSARHEETFKAGLKSFVNEARLLARFDHPALVKVYRFWEENGTAYMVMPFYEGPTLKSALASLGKPPDEAALRAWLRPLLDALGVMHAAQCYHRDIAPDNILLTPTGPLLLDFGAARRVIGDMTHALTVVLKPGYAPIEQYGDVATMAQGAWTDLYALACVIYFAITGKVPMSSVERLMDDRLEPLARLAAGRYSPGLLRAVDAALAVRPQDRPQTDAQFRAMFDPPAAAPRITPSAPPPSTPLVVPKAAAPSLAPTSDPAARIVTAPRAVPLDPVMPAVPVVRPTPPRAGPTVPPEARVPVPAPSPPAAPAPTLPPPSAARAPVVERIEPRTAPPARAAPPPPPPSSSPLPPPIPPARADTSLREATTKAPPIRATASRAEPPRTRRTSVYAAVGAVCLIAAGAGALHFLGGRSPDSPQGVGPAASAPSTAPRDAEPAPAAPTPAPVPPPTATTVAPTPAAPSAPVVVESPAPAPPPAVAKVPNPAPPPSSRTASPSSTEPPATAPAVREPVPEPTPARVRREPPARVEAAPAPPKVVPSRNAGVQSRCSDILQKASLEPLTSEETAFLKRECR